jgi:hypothetical protein
MTTLDYLVLIIMAVSIISGAVTGIVKGTIGVVSAVVGLAKGHCAYNLARDARNVSWRLHDNKGIMGTQLGDIPASAGGRSGLAATADHG